MSCWSSDSVSSFGFSTAVLRIRGETIAETLSLHNRHLLATDAFPLAIHRTSQCTVLYSETLGYCLVVQHRSPDPGIGGGARGGGGQG